MTALTFRYEVLGGFGLYVATCHERLSLSVSASSPRVLAALASRAVRHAHPAYVITMIENKHVLGNEIAFAFAALPIVDVRAKLAEWKPYVTQGL